MDKSKKFKSLAEARVNKLLKSIKLIGNLANRSTYDYTDDEVRQIFKAIQAELDAAKQKFASKGKRGGNEFRFK